MWTILKVVLFILFLPITLPVWIVIKLVQYFKKPKKRELTPVEKFMEKANTLRDGMPMEEVVQIMGGANGKQSDGDKVMLTWEFNEDSPKYGLVTRKVVVEFINYRINAIMREKFDVPVFLPETRR